MQRNFKVIYSVPQEGAVVYKQQLPEIVDEPDYEAALAAL